MPEGERIEIEWEYLSVRANNALKKQGIGYIDQLTNFTRKEVLKWKNIGKVTVNEIHRFLAKYGLSFKDECINPEIEKILHKESAAILEKIKTQIKDSWKELEDLRFKIKQISTDDKSFKKR